MQPNTAIMPYSQFTNISKTKEAFGLKTKEGRRFIPPTEPIEPSATLTAYLEESLPLAASASEKARSEMIISPILLEVRRKLENKISLFSGVDFNVDNTRGLNGFCDFLISLSQEQLFIRAPAITLVETKNENLKSALGQCIAEMIAAQLFNEMQGNTIKSIYGVISIGTIWQFLKLEDNHIYIDLSEYYIQDIEKILGILTNALRQN